MELYTQRHGMRKPKETTYDISIESYALLLNCCERYYKNLAWKFPDLCDYCHKCVTLNDNLFNTAVKYEIPTLFRKDGIITAPSSRYNVFDKETHNDEYDQFALIDLIEYIAINCRDYDQEYDNECEHAYLTFIGAKFAFKSFQSSINSTFDTVGLLYKLTDKKQVERIINDTPLTKEVEATLLGVNESETQKLIKEAIDLHKSPYPDSIRDATEKIWDAFERLKTYYTNMKKKDSAEKIVLDISNGSNDFKAMIETEFKVLTDIGNDYRIRHHETNKINITDTRHYDYFFNRCLSVIALAVQFLK